eukprot:TRINITY_DN58324_c0_g1_i1.p2 TRINITY_DN58324_c0_g1~~TRINITY_DN58324_c0_g1_i1.p2  ORF type:complete len:239 (-),score=24.52 TRINITY_DN58324_c0_g1_i1:82-798(-)
MFTWGKGQAIDGGDELSCKIVGPAGAQFWKIACGPHCTAAIRSCPGEEENGAGAEQRRDDASKSKFLIPASNWDLPAISRDSSRALHSRASVVKGSNGKIGRRHSISYPEERTPAGSLSPLTPVSGLIPDDKDLLLLPPSLVPSPPIAPAGPGKRPAGMLRESQNHSRGASSSRPRRFTHPGAQGPIVHLGSSLDLLDLQPALDSHVCSDDDSWDESMPDDELPMIALPELPCHVRPG